MLFGADQIQQRHARAKTTISSLLGRGSGSGGSATAKTTTATTVVPSGPRHRPSNISTLSSGGGVPTPTRFISPRLPANTTISKVRIVLFCAICGGSMTD